MFNVVPLSLRVGLAYVDDDAGDERLQQKVPPVHPSRA
jgi:hypothetical protein